MPNNYLKIGTKCPYSSQYCTLKICDGCWIEKNSGLLEKGYKSIQPLSPTPFDKRGNKVEELMKIREEDNE